ncbi:unnamed protein product [Lampetra planeri]
MCRSNLRRGDEAVTKAWRVGGSHACRNLPPILAREPVPLARSRFPGPHGIRPGHSAPAPTALADPGENRVCDAARAGQTHERREGLPAGPTRGPARKSDALLKIEPP